MAGVRVLNVSQVALQPGPYPSPGETIQLSFLDSIWVSAPHMQCVFLYPDTADASFAAILSSLKSSLALVLPSFHPFASKLAYISSDDKAIIDCSASAIREGVAIIEAESDLDIYTNIQTVVYFVGSPRFKAYETDFGWGKPNRIELASSNLDGEVVMLSGKDEGTVKASLQTGLCKIVQTRNSLANYSI